MKVLALAMTALALAATPAIAMQQAPADTGVQQQQDPAAMLNRAAVLVEQGDYVNARALYNEVLALHVDYTLETTAGQFLHPATIARRGINELDKRTKRVNIASRR